MMRIAICDRPHHIEVQRRPIPAIDGHKVLVQVTLCGVCGSDVTVWQGRGHKRYPYSPGHEFCGTVQRIGQKVAGLHIGQRVVINPNLGCGECRYCLAGRPNLCDFLKTRPIKSNGGFSEYVALDAGMVYPLPASLPDEIAPFIEPLSCALYAVQRAGIEPGERVAVFGAGIIGLLVALVLQSCECAPVVIEPDRERREGLAGLLGVPAVAPGELADPRWAGTVDVAIDCSGNVRALSQALTVLRKGGRLLMMGLVEGGTADFPLMEVTTKELEVKGVWLNPIAFEDAVRLTTGHQSVLQALKTEAFALDDVEAAFERAASRQVHKVLVKP